MESHAVRNPVRVWRNRDLGLDKGTVAGETSPDP